MIKNKHRLFLIFLFAISISLYFFLPKIKFSKPYSVVLYDSNGDLLDYQVAKDGQWRLKNNYDKIPEKYLYCLLLFEDKNFFFHKGIDIIALFRAAFLNLKHNKKVSGGSTITMQVARLYYGNSKRTYIQKIKEIFLALYIEITLSKTEILKLYMQHAPFGGNVEGTEAASFKYFNRSLKNLSWTESALLAVLPKNPSNVNFKKNKEVLRKRRNNLLFKLFLHGIINKNTYLLSVEEEIMVSEDKPSHDAPHLLVYLNNNYPGQITYETFINREIQSHVYEILERYRKELESNQIYNVATLICELPSKNVITYIGNFHDSGNKSQSYRVNMIEANRSGGSILKPFLYATMLDNGELLPNMLLPDIPIQIGGYSPKNFNNSYDGAVKANTALARSLNIPAVKMLQQYGVQRFIDFMKKNGFTTINKSQEYYGLSLILGGCEIKMSELLNAYANMATTLTNGFASDNINYFKFQQVKNKEIPLTKGSIWLTFKAMNEVERPQNQSYWYLYQNKRNIAWKTGTSFGFRDAWAVAITPDYAVAVWVGNATGKSSAELTGIKKAAPILFDILAILPYKKSDFEIPYDDLQIIKVCKESGYLPGQHCNEHISEITSKTNIKIKTCPYHKLIFLDSSGKFRVHNDCEDASKIKKETFFVLSPTMEYYYKKRNPTYKTLPGYRGDCLSNIISQQNIEIVYPQISTNLYVPKNLDGSLSSVVFEATHRRNDAIIYWYLDKNFIGETQYKHVLSVQPSIGKHILTLQDEYGETKEITFNVVYSSSEKN
jgi:penicillin-binding protein 1C